MIIFLEFTCMADNQIGPLNIACNGILEPESLEGQPGTAVWAGQNGTAPHLQHQLLITAGY